MSWFADLAGKAECLLNNLDEQTGAALRNHNVAKKKHDKNENNIAQIQTDTTWGHRRRAAPRSIKKPANAPENIKTSPCRKSSPTSNHQSRSLIKDNPETKTIKSRKSPARKPSPTHTITRVPKTIIGDCKDSEDSVITHYGTKQRRYSLPSELELMNNEDDWMYKMQNLEVENTMLKNELNVMNREVAQLLDRLRKTEDEVTKARMQLETTELLNDRTNLEKETLSSQMEEVKVKLTELAATELSKHKEDIRNLQKEVNLLKEKNKELEEKCKEQSIKLNEKDMAQIKLENDLRHAQSTITELQSNLEKSTGECRRLEKDWEAYKLRVKNMLQAKDKEIKTLQEGMDISEDTKELMEQIDLLKEERDELSEATASVRSECDDMKQYLVQVEARHCAAERVVCALRDALRDERAARNRADAQWACAAKDLKCLQIETGQAITSLRSALREKDNEISRLRETTSTLRTTDTSALNVADYDVQDSIEQNKLQYLTQTLMQRQSKIDKLLADNNMLKIQLEKLEAKYKTEISAVRVNYSHSVVHLQEGEVRHRSRTYAATDTLSALSVRMGVMVKRYPIMRIFVILYMVCLHFWVLTVLLTHTPEDMTVRASKS